MRRAGLRYDSDEGRGAPCCTQSSVFQRLGAVNRLVRPPSADAMRDLPLPETPEGAILASQRPGIRGMSGLYLRNPKGIVMIFDYYQKGRQE